MVIGQSRPVVIQLSPKMKSTEDINVRAVFGRLWMDRPRQLWDVRLLGMCFWVEIFE